MGEVFAKGIANSNFYGGQDNGQASLLVADDEVKNCYENLLRSQSRRRP